MTYPISEAFREALREWGAMQVRLAGKVAMVVKQQKWVLPHP